MPYPTTIGQSVVRRPIFAKSNVELINSLRANFSSSSQEHVAAAHHHHSATGSSSTTATPTTNSETSSLPSSTSFSDADYTRWTTKDGDTLYVPSWQPTPLTEPRDSYDVTVKLFYLPGIPSSRRCKHTREAIDLVLKELGVDSIDLLIVSYPGVSFDADDYDGDEEGEEGDDGQDQEVASMPDEDASAHSHESEGFDAQIKAWRVLESLHSQGVISQLGVSEFSSERLDKFLPEVTVRPTVDQINVKDCCVVPKPLIVYAQENKIELLTHADCTDILPPGTTRELLGTGKDGAGIIAARPDAGPDEPGLKGDIEPQWVIKYTAVVKNRGVIENKGYFAVAQLGTCIEDSTADGEAAGATPSS
ncbi:glutamate-cysteine ligase regulatory subunit [Exophiala aquamarina CBS 119918]|uniref:GCS light chain n=1 Tax=Exophiala aquamarina CBS 119918 TaxID=1182545 RepID=A0A072PD46_9EURO|nr:glutamate-cysteine ligase regulatory subunit [Exophiala aquamarina CBS 119918]KEF57692.1 glutamate-cysteine ligase regulatory subunit [Exophiala aquamarina CBS 119918]